MSNTDQMIRRLQVPAGDQQLTITPGSKKTGVGSASIGTSREAKGSSATSSLVGGRRDLRANAGNDVHGEQWSHVEQRGCSDWLKPMGRKKSGSAGGGSGSGTWFPFTGEIDPWDSNSIILDLEGPTSLTLKTKTGDDETGSIRQTLVSRVMYVTLWVKTNGHRLKLPSLYTQDGELPDLTPTNSGVWQVLTIAILRIGVQPTNQVGDTIEEYQFLHGYQDNVLKGAAQV